MLGHPASWGMALLSLLSRPSHTQFIDWTVMFTSIGGEYLIKHTPSYKLIRVTPLAVGELKSTDLVKTMLLVLDNLLLRESGGAAGRRNGDQGGGGASVRGGVCGLRSRDGVGSESKGAG